MADNEWVSPGPLVFRGPTLWFMALSAQPTRRKVMGLLQLLPRYFGRLDQMLRRGGLWDPFQLNLHDL